MAVNDKTPDASGDTKHLDAAVDLLAGLVLDAFQRDPDGLRARAAQRVLAELEAAQDADADAFEEGEGARELLADLLGVEPGEVERLAGRQEGRQP
jgi:hypothetical protein